MEPPPPFRRLKKAQLVQVLVVYLGAAWLVIEITAFLQQTLELPDWVSPVALILLMVGLVVVLATAWIQSHPVTDRREEDREVPRDWELDLRHFGRSVRRGELPHLTWGRTAVGGLFAFALLFGAAGLYVVVQDRGRAFAPQELAAEEADPGVAVLPFSVSGSDLELWREGMVDLLSTNLDGIGGLRAIDSRTVLARWREAVGGQETPDLATTLAAARRAGARWALIGNAISLGSEVRITASIHHVPDGRQAGTPLVVEGPVDDVMDLVDQLSVLAARALLAEEAPPTGGIRLASVTTQSPEALRHFLEGEAHYRRSDFPAATESYERAVAVDSTFALAYRRYGSAMAWSSADSEQVLWARERSHRFRGRLPPREALLAEGEYQLRSGHLSEGLETLTDLVRRYPDDPEAWYELGDAHLHFGSATLVPAEEAERSLRRAAELDPSFAPYWIHLVDAALARGDSAEAAELLEEEASTARSDTRELEAHRLIFSYLFGPTEERARILAELPSTDRNVLRWVAGVSFPYRERWDGILALRETAARELISRPGAGPAELIGFLSSLLDQGKVREASGLLEAWEAREPVLGAYARIAMRNTALAPEVSLGSPADLPESGSFADAVAAWVALEGGDVREVERRLAGLDERLEASRTAADSLEARRAGASASLLRGMRLRRSGQERAAVPHLERTRDDLAGILGEYGLLHSLATWELAVAREALGQSGEALRLYESLDVTLHGAAALHRRAAIHAARGEHERARELYRTFLGAWREADPGHPWVARARAATGS